MLKLHVTWENNNEIVMKLWIFCHHWQIHVCVVLIFVLSILDNHIATSKRLRHSSTLRHRTECDVTEVSAREFHGFPVRVYSLSTNESATR